jgi:16S rRNA (cytosine967-C5)-methyltransferase
MRRALSVAGIDASDHPEVETALRLAAPARGVNGLPAYQEGLIELQDAHSQAVVLALPLHPDQRVLDLCAGGGGKTLAIGAHCPVRLFAHDGDPGRMRDLPARAIRAGQDVRILQLEEPETLAPFDLVLADVPCSGSGSWRRAPEGKWRLTPERYAALRAEQSAILDRAAALTAPKGWLAYVTCSVFDRENGEQAEAFLQRTPGWTRRMVKNWPIGEAGDGFHLSLFQKTD